MGLRSPPQSRDRDCDFAGPRDTPGPGAGAPGLAEHELERDRETGTMATGRERALECMPAPGARQAAAAPGGDVDGGAGAQVLDEAPDARGGDPEGVHAPPGPPPPR